MDYSFLSTTNLFHGISENEIPAMLSCLAGHEKNYRKGDIILHTGDTVSEIGLILEGSVNVVVNFYRGNSNIFNHLFRGQLFAESYAAIPGQELFCDIVAAESSSILFLNMNKLLSTCSNCCSFHNRIIHNLTRTLAENNLRLSSRMMHIASKSIRDRLLSYLSELALTQNSMHILVPFSRQQLADYLSVDRSALSNELSKMQRDGLITYHKNEFTLLKDPSDLQNAF